MAKPPLHWALDPLPKGWFHHGAAVLTLLEQHQPHVIVELGTHGGASAIAMARVAAAWNGVLYCVDTWHGRPKPGIGPGRILECAANLQRAKVHARCRLIPSTTAEAAACWRGPIDALYIDADHGYEGLTQDLELWTPHVRSGGLILGDDYEHPTIPTVKQAWDDFEARHGLHLIRLETPNPLKQRLIYGYMP